jgi:hypothetical protein
MTLRPEFAREMADEVLCALRETPERQRTKTVVDKIRRGVVENHLSGLHADIAKIVEAEIGKEHRQLVTNAISKSTTPLKGALKRIEAGGGGAQQRGGNKKMRVTLPPQQRTELEKRFNNIARQLEEDLDDNSVRQLEGERDALLRQMAQLESSETKAVALRLITTTKEMIPETKASAIEAIERDLNTEEALEPVNDNEELVVTPMVNKKHGIRRGAVRWRKAPSEPLSIVEENNDDEGDNNNNDDDDDDDMDEKIAGEAK